MITWKDVIHFAVKGNPTPDNRVEKTPAEWKALLTPEQFRITRNKGTEAPGSGALCSSHELGKYACICCDTLLFDSSIKFESGSGWPSFTALLKKMQYSIPKMKPMVWFVLRLHATPVMHI